MRKIFFITIPSIFIFLLVLEIGLRIGGFFYTRYRNPETYANVRESDSKVFNILCLGDSFTFGFGASPGNSYPRQLERILQESVSEDMNVIDGGRGGNTSSLLLKNLQKDIDDYHPDVILIMIGSNNLWNLEDSSYFVLNRDNLSFQKRLDKKLGGLRVYKLAKIGWLNFKHKMNVSKNKGNKLVSDKNAALGIEPNSAKLSIIGAEFYARGKYDLAAEKLKEALAIDNNNYEAHLWLAHIWNARYEFLLAKEELWRAVYALDRWDNAILSRIINQIIVMHDTMLDRQLELIKLKEYLQEEGYGDKHELINSVEANLDFLKDADMHAEVLRYDLREILKLAKENRVKVVLQTYPANSDSIIKEISKRQSIPLVDNELVFESKAANVDIRNFFVADGHCNDKGYKLIAENVYATLIKEGVLPQKSKGRGDGKRE